MNASYKGICVDFNKRKIQHSIGFPTFKYYKAFMIDLLNIKIDNFSIWLLGLMIEFSCPYIPKGHYFINTVWLWSTDKNKNCFILSINPPLTISDWNNGSTQRRSKCHQGISVCKGLLGEEILIIFFSCLWFICLSMNCGFEFITSVHSSTRISQYWLVPGTELRAMITSIFIDIKVCPSDLLIDWYKKQNKQIQT